MPDRFDEIYIERTDAHRNMARFYALSIEPTLFGEFCLVRRWGRIGTHGQRKTMSFPSQAQASEQFAEIHRQKTRRGYRERTTEVRSSLFPGMISDR